MCGIAGYLASKDETDIDVRGLATDLLLEIQSRGTDATGAAWFDGDTIMVQKDALPARQFVPNLELPSHARNVILHTRFETQGSHRNNDNNHPIITGGIVGVHNGGIWNDDSLFRRMDIEDKRIAQVDTEAVFAAIAYGTETGQNGKPRLGDNLMDVLGEISGSAAIAWLNVNGDPDVMELARISGSPLHWGQTKKGTFVFASTKEAIEKATKKNDLEIVHWDFATEGDYYLIRGGRVDTVERFKPLHSSYSKGNSWSFDSRSNAYKDDKNGTKKATTTPKGGSSNTLNTGDGGTAKWVSPDAIHAKLCLVMDSELSEPSTNYHYAWYRDRENAIDAFLADVGEDTEQPANASNLAGRLHGFAREGTWVLTDLSENYKAVRAQIYLMPQTFPNGSYLLRALIPNPRYETGFEPVIIERKDHEFTIIKNPDEAQFPKNPYSTKD